MGSNEKSQRPPLPPPLPSSSICHQKDSQIEKNESDCSMELLKKNFETSLERLVQLEEKFDNIFCMYNVYLPPQLQEGPKCGLVALSIASAINKFVEVDTIYQEAVDLKYTKQGEIFEAEFLVDLAKKCCNLKAKTIKGGLYSHTFCILNHLLQNQVLLVPYDADYNHSPCCKKGYRAHWAVITGFLVLTSLSSTSSSEVTEVSIPTCFTCNCCEIDFKSYDSLYLSYKENKIFFRKKSIYSSKSIENISEGKIYLTGMQGKSKNIGIWSFDDMAESNDNLNLISPDRSAKSYVIPETGIANGLKGKAVLLCSF